jgi:hypothetical protein
MEKPGGAVPSADIWNLFGRASRRVDVEEFVRSGRRQVYVLHLSKVEALIREAVERAVAAASDEKLSADSKRIEEEAKKRFEELAARHREVLRLTEQAQAALSRLADGLANARPGNLDLEGLSGQVAAMASLLRTENPPPQEKERPLLSVLQSLAGEEGKAGDDRIERILLQMERLASAVEATERQMRRLGPAAGTGRAPEGAGSAARPNVDLFRAILEENLKIARGTSADETS